MNIPFYKPESALLSKYIDGFYFIAEKDILKSNQYWTFPNNFCLATVCLDTDLVPEKRKITIRKSSAKRVDSFLFYNVSNPVEVTYETPRNEVTIYFKPLAIFHFFPDVRFDAEINHIENFEPFNDYLSSIQMILKMEDKNAQASTLEAYLISKFQYKKQEIIEDILQKIEDDWKINDIAVSLNISRQYINRIFFKHTGKSPAQYKKIRRFRQTILSQHSNEKFISLSHKNLFFDQPHFNREFKDITGVIPTVFFKNVDTTKNMLWFFV